MVMFHSFLHVYGKSHHRHRLEPVTWRRTWNVWTILLLWAGDIGFNAPRKVGPQGTRGEAGVTWQKMGDIMGMFLETKAICSALQPSCPVIDWGFTLSARSFVLVIQISTKLRCNLRSKSLRWSDTLKMLHESPWVATQSSAYFHFVLSAPLRHRYPSLAAR